MIIFEKIKFKNFLSYGNIPTEYDFLAAKTTCITGTNGAGKSSLLCALTYALYGKAFRDIGIPQLMNTVNHKNMEVTIWFSINDIKYKIVRGKSPNVFEIWVNDQLLPQDAASKDYQGILADQILRMNYNTFTQIIILGSASFTPFMSLKPPVRKSIIENILDISIFSLMNVVVRERISVFKDVISTINHKIEILNTTYKLKQEHIADSEEKVQRQIVDINARILSYIDIVETAKKEMVVIDEKILLIPQLDINPLRLKKNKLNEFNIKIKSNIARIEADRKYIGDADTCDKCSQAITQEFKDTRSAELIKKLGELQAGIDKLAVSIAEVDLEIKRAEDVKSEKDILVYEKDKVQTRISVNNRFMQSLQDDVTKLSETKEKETQVNLEEIEKEIKEYDEKKAIETFNGKVLDAAIRILKDDGVKTKVIRHYLPVINHYCNHYLSKLGFDILFMFDEGFNEIIKSRYRDNFSYGSFSEGEKSRINLALLFTWREIARLKNCAECNILILDEIMDSSLDSSGIDDFLSVISEGDKKLNITIISHREETKSSNFDRYIKVTKNGNFSKLEESE